MALVVDLSREFSPEKPEIVWDVDFFFFFFLSGFFLHVSIPEVDRGFNFNGGGYCGHLE